MCQPFHSTLFAVSFVFDDQWHLFIVRSPPSTCPAGCSTCGVFASRNVCFEVIYFSVFIPIAMKLCWRACAVERNPRRIVCHKDKCCLTRTPHPQIISICGHECESPFSSGGRDDFPPFFLPAGNLLSANVLATCIPIKSRCICLSKLLGLLPFPLE